MTVPPMEKPGCPSGFICSPTGELESCDAIRQRAIESGWGDIHAGMYCPANYAGLWNCPVGHYCPDSRTKIVCPEGYFCPHKSNEYVYKCGDCGEGAEKLRRTFAGYIITIVIVAGLVLYQIIIKRVVNRLRKIQEAKQAAKEAESHGLDTNDDEADQEAKLLRQAQIARISHKLHILGNRLQQLGMGDPNKPIFHMKRGKDGKTTMENFDAGALFDRLDGDGDSDGFLDFGELNSIMKLEKKQMKAFIAAMNEFSGASSKNKKVTREAFVKHFLDVLEKASSVAPSREDCSILFGKIAEVNGLNAHQQVEYKDFYESSLASFLTDVQILKLIRFFKENTAPAQALGGSGAFRKSFKTAEQPARTNARAERGSMARSFVDLTSGFFTSQDTEGIDRDNFIRLYPKGLEHVISNDDEEGDKQLKVGLDIAFEDLCLTVKKGDKEVNVVDHCTGRLRSNTMTALLGGSGAGKTSLLNALCGRASYGKVTGVTKINGHVASIDDYQSVIGFVPQDDIVFAELTVLENFMYNGLLRLPRGTPLEEINDLAEETVASLGLRRVANNLVGDHRRRGLSGGEKKRVNIGLELMARPQICFLDEPTSGLDSHSAWVVMNSLRSLVDNQGITIATVIHQPRKTIFELFDSLILLGVGGQMMYHGPASGAEWYFKDLDFVLEKGESLSDWLIDISSGTLTPRKVQAIEGKKTKGAEKKSDSEAKTPEEIQNKLAKFRREQLVFKWKCFFEDLPKEYKADYEAPSDMVLPEILPKSSGFRQFQHQCDRIALLWWRNRFSHITDFNLIIVVAMILAAVNGVLEATVTDYPDIPYMVLAAEDTSYLEEFLPVLFRFSILGTKTEYALTVTLIVGILTGLAACKTLTAFRDNFYREAGSGIPVTPYFLAVNVTSATQVTSDMICSAIGAHWARQSFVNPLHIMCIFMGLGWLVSSWAMLIPLIIPANSITIVFVCFIAFFAVLLGGASSNFTFVDIYGSKMLQLIAGFFSTNRYAIEAFLVGEARCLPPQTGFAIQFNAPGYDLDKGAYGVVGLAQNDLETVIEQSCGGWYWGFSRAIMVGVTIRLLAGGLIHIAGRGKQGKKPILETILQHRDRAIMWGVYAVVLLLTAIFTGYLILN